MIKKIRYLDWRNVWFWFKWPIAIALWIILAVLMFSCTGVPEVKTTQAKQIKDPLAFDHKQRESVSMYLKRYGQPELFWSYSDDDLKFEVFQWKKADPERWAIRINGIYKFTWTQFKNEKETTK
jgi:hypothetical protein